jgi:hypothetical protein
MRMVEGRMQIDDDHFRKLERMYHGAPINRFFALRARAGSPGHSRSSQITMVYAYEVRRDPLTYAHIGI